MRVVLDTVVFVRGLINPFGPCGQIAFPHASRFELVLSEPMLVEILEVLRRPELTRKFRSLAERNTERVLAILGEATVVELSSIPAVSRDPKDDTFLATALAAQADYLVSEDIDLLDLGTHGSTAIVTCREFIAILDRLAESPAGT